MKREELKKLIEGRHPNWNFKESRNIRLESGNYYDNVESTIYFLLHNSQHYYTLENKKTGEEYGSFTYLVDAQRYVSYGLYYQIKKYNKMDIEEELNELVKTFTNYIEK